eukprot:CAMPEP_0181489144 /NCGR_PEP_ID=MMETSP1110-20121109/48797_1 /TAXON_ID=174948 /ORGANISM="Symbiodinium sp., Strain CCMP421" /LENGTH=442 /DNA_ID=CAMNT_0023615901 /DNA_START=62 /DNA_END=1387 /DNA_ORIENTATION=+
MSGKRTVEQESFLDAWFQMNNTVATKEELRALENDVGTLRKEQDQAVDSLGTLIRKVAESMAESLHRLEDRIMTDMVNTAVQRVKEQVIADLPQAPTPARRPSLTATHKASALCVESAPEETVSPASTEKMQYEKATPQTSTEDEEGNSTATTPHGDALGFAPKVAKIRPPAEETPPLPGADPDQALQALSTGRQQVCQLLEKFSTQLQAMHVQLEADCKPPARRVGLLKESSSEKTFPKPNEDMLRRLDSVESCVQEALKELSQREAALSGDKLSDPLARTTPAAGPSALTSASLFTCGLLDKKAELMSTSSEPGRTWRGSTQVVPGSMCLQRKTLSPPRASSMLVSSQIGNARTVSPPGSREVQTARMASPWRPGLSDARARNFGPVASGFWTMTPGSLDGSTRSIAAYYAPQAPGMGHGGHSLRLAPSRRLERPESARS